MLEKCTSITQITWDSGKPGLSSPCLSCFACVSLFSGTPRYTKQVLAGKVNTSSHVSHNIHSDVFSAQLRPSFVLAIEHAKVRPRQRRRAELVWCAWRKIWIYISEIKLRRLGREHLSSVQLLLWWEFALSAHIGAISHGSLEEGQACFCWKGGTSFPWKSWCPG